MSETIGGLGLDLDISRWLIATRNAVNAIDTIEKRALRHNQTLTKLEGAYGRAASQLRQFVSLAGVGFGVSQLIRYADNWTNVNSKIRLVTSSTEELNLIQQTLFKTAQATRTAFGATVDLYTRVARSAKTLGKSQTELIQLTTSVNQAMQISGSSAGSAQAALIQLGQAFSSGTLRGEELNSVLEQAPRLAEAIATGMKVTTGQLRLLGAQGKLTSQAVVDALLSQSKAIDTEYGKMTKTIAQSFTQLSNVVQRFVGQQGEASGAAATLSKAISALAENFDRLIPLLMTLAGIKVAVMIGGWVSALTAMGGGLSGMFALVTRATSMLGGLRTAALLAGRALGTMMAGLGGPVGVVLTGIAISWGILANNTAAAAAKTAELRAEYEKLNLSQLNAKIFDLNVSYDLLLTRMEDLKKNGRAIPTGMNEELGETANQIRLLTSVIKQLQDQEKLNAKGTAPPKIISEEERKKMLALLKVVQDLKDRVADMKFEMSEPSAMASYRRQLADLAKEYAKAAKEAGTSVAAQQEFAQSLKALEVRKAALEFRAFAAEVEDLRNALTPSTRDDAITQLNRQLADMEKRGVGEFLRDLWKTYQMGVIEAAEATDRLQQTLTKLSTLKPIPRLAALANEETQLRTAIAFEKSAVKRNALERELNVILAERDGIISQFATEGTIPDTVASDAENLARGMQTAFSSAFENIFKDGLSSFTNLFKSIEQLFYRLVAEMAAADIIKKVFKTDSKGNILGISDKLGGKGTQAGLSAAVIGYGVGSSIGSTTTNRGVGALGGAAGGAGAGALIGSSILPGVGTAIGAIAGGVAGLVGGFISSGKKAKEAAEAMKKAREAFERNLKDFTDAAFGNATELSQRLQQIEDTRKKLSDDAKVYIPKDAGLGKASPDQAFKYLDELKKQGVDLGKGLETYYQALKKINDSARELSKRLKQEALDNIEAQLNDAKGQGFVTSGGDIIKQYELNRKVLEQTGGDVGKAAEIMELQFRKLASSLTDEQFAVLLASLPDAFKEMAKRARDAAQAGEDLNRVLTEQGKALILDTKIREKVLAGDYRGAAKDSLERDIELAVKQAKAEGLAADEIERLTKVMRGEFLKALQEAEEATQRDIQVRRLALAGKNDEAQILSLMISQESEMTEARRKGLSETTLAALAALQAEERLAAIRKLEAERAEKNARLFEDLELRRAAVLERLGGKGQDFAQRRLEIEQRREISDAERDGETAPQIRARKYQQELERLAFAFERETTKMIEAITSRVTAEVKAIDDKIASEAGKIEGYRAQIESIAAAAAAQIAVIDADLDIQRAALQVAEDGLKAAESQAKELRKMADAFKEFADSLVLDRAFSTLSPEEYLKETERRYRESTPDNFIETAKNYLSAAKDYFASSEAYQRIFAEVQGRANALASKSGSAASTAEQTLSATTATRDGILRQIEVLEKQREDIRSNAQKEIEALQKQIEASAKVIEGLEKQRQAVIEAGNKQIEELIKAREEAFVNAVKQLEEQQKTREDIARLTDVVRGDLADVTPVVVAIPNDYFDAMEEAVGKPIVEAVDKVGEGIKGMKDATVMGSMDTSARIRDLSGKIDELISINRLVASAPI